MQNERVSFEQKISPGQGNRQESASLLLPSIDSALKKLGWNKADLDFIVVNVGPGSFTGVRVSVIAARSIAQALSLGVVPVSSLDIMALQAIPPLAVVLNAGAGKCYAGIYRSDFIKKNPGSVPELFVSDLDSLDSRLAGCSSLILEAGLEEYISAKDRSVIVYPPESNRATEGALLALKRICSACLDLNPATLAAAYPWDNVLPLYLRSPSVTLKGKNGSSDKTIARG